MAWRASCSPAAIPRTPMAILAEDSHSGIASEGLIASLVVFYCAGKLLRGWSTLSAASRAFFAGAIGVELLVILLSYRRASWYGLLLAAFYFVWLLPRNKRAITALLVVLPMVAGGDIPQFGTKPRAPARATCRRSTGLPLT